MRVPGLILSAAFALTATVFAQKAGRQSPFLPPQSAAPAAAAVSGTHEFTGVIVAGKSVLVNLTDTQRRRSFWIAVGQTVDGIEALGFDPKAENVTVRLNRETKTLALKQPSVAASSGTAIATVSVSPMVPLPPPSTPAEAEREARMLVSDLLEIGIQQRKAYEEAQRRAATEAAKKLPPSVSVVPPKA